MGGGGTGPAALAVMLLGLLVQGLTELAAGLLLAGGSVGRSVFVGGHEAMLRRTGQTVKEKWTLVSVANL